MVCSSEMFRRILTHAAGGVQGGHLEHADGNVENKKGSDTYVVAETY